MVSTKSMERWKSGKRRREGMRSIERLFINQEEDNQDGKLKLKSHFSDMRMSDPLSFFVTPSSLYASRYLPLVIRQAFLVNFGVSMEKLVVSKV